MTAFLTSSPTGPLDGSRTVTGFDPSNGFLAQLSARWPEDARCLMISAFPDDAPANDQMRSFFEEAVHLSGLPCVCFDLWDSRTPPVTAETLQTYGVLLLGGGHVPTQNAFFQRIRLREKLNGFAGIVIGISAGSMNAADVVYAQPEEPGESADPSYRRYLSGLGITKTCILPHYQMSKTGCWTAGGFLKTSPIPTVSASPFSPCVTAVTCSVKTAGRRFSAKPIPSATVKYPQLLTTIVDNS